MKYIFICDQRKGNVPYKVVSKTRKAANGFHTAWESILKTGMEPVVGMTEDEWKEVLPELNKIIS